MNKKTTENTREQICEEYKNGMSYRDLENKYGMCHRTIWKFLKGQNLTKPRDAHKYQCDWDFFKTIDSQEKAYWLGFLYADGAIGCDGVVVNLQWRDRDHLQKFLDCLHSNHNVIKQVFYDKKYEKFRTRARIVISSRSMMRDLTNKGCPQRKTNTIRWPSEDIVPECLLTHFFRGYFDGDGCVHNGKTKYVSVLSNYKFCEKMQLWLMNSCSLDKTKIIPHKGTWAVHYSGINQVSKIYYLIYDNSMVSLSRKETHFESFVLAKEDIGEKQNNKLSDSNIKEIILDYKNGCGIKQISNDHNISENYLYKLLAKNNSVLRENHKKHTIDAQKIIGLYNSNLKMGEVRRLSNGISYASIYRILKVNNVLLRKK
jgi:hypothetical protein